MVLVAKNKYLRSWHYSLLLGLGIALLGVMSLAIAPIARLEPDVGLKWLFNLRGARPAPENVIVVTVDRDSSIALGLPNVPRKWPRALHADLVTKLKSAGASVISFDMIFTDHRDPEEDKKFARAMNDAGSVILFEYMQSETIEYQNGEDTTAVHIEKRLPPIPEFTASALAVAPFHLPKVPERVNQAWLFKSGAGDLPTIPVVAIHKHFLNQYTELQQTIVTRLNADEIPDWLNAATPPSNPADFAIKLHQLFIDQPDVLKKIYRNNQDSDFAPLIYTHLHGQEGGIFLDFYGPARSVNTIAYHQILEDIESFNLRGKAVFVGFSERLQPEQKDGFFTAFTDNKGLDVSGVEIMATTFANLLEERHVQPLKPPYNIFLVVVFGFLTGVLLYRLQGTKAVLLTITLATTYFTMAYWLFNQHAIWLPLVIPILIQLPFTLVLALLSHYLLSHREKGRLHDAFSKYLPEHIANAAAESGFSGHNSQETGFGVCLATDAKNFTALSEKLSSDKLFNHLNAYYEEVFTPVRNNKGLVMDVIGDAMMSAWVKDDSRIMRESACRAAIEIQERLKQLDNSFPTRIGLHCGEVSMGNVGAGDHYEFRVVGDVVNTSSRIEGLNKYLDTHILASAETIQGLENISTRRLGQFRLKGKQKSLIIYELFPEHPADSLCDCFSNALKAFENQDWSGSIQSFSDCLKNHPKDGPSQFYLSLANEYQNTPPTESWDGVVNISQK